jgi:hypothetical protein
MKYPDEILVKVTHQDIKNSNKAAWGLRSETCPVAQSLTRMGYKPVVTPENIYLYGYIDSAIKSKYRILSESSATYTVPDPGIRFINHVDKYRQDAYPISFTIRRVR